MEERIDIDRTTYTLVKEQRSGIGIYRSEHAYLRIGPPDAIQLQREMHVHLEERGFPVPKMLSSGVHAGFSYFTEESLGERRFLDLFANDFSQTGVVSERRFAEFITICERFFRAQMRSEERPSDERIFASAIHVDLLTAELPSHEVAIREQFARRFKNVSVYPSRVMHGDFNPSNTYPRGVIDFEDTSSGPVGYDLTCAITTQEWFPQGTQYEFPSRYRLSEAHVQRFVAHFDAIFAKYSLQSLSHAVDDFEFFRAIWLTVRMHKWPRLQKYRYDLFIKKYLS